MDRSDAQEKSRINYLDFLDAVFAIHLSIIFGLVLNEIVADIGIQLPTFATCLFTGVLLTNLVPKSFPRLSGRNWLRAVSRLPAEEGLHTGRYRTRL